jgi:hypothetical protein
VKALLIKSDLHVERALVAILAAQTADEQAGGFTVHHNKVGFSGADAEFGTSLAKQINKSKREAGKRLSPKQLPYARKIAIKYRKQLTRQANERFAIAVAEGLAGLVAFAAASENVAQAA